MLCDGSGKGVTASQPIGRYADGEYEGTYSKSLKSLVKEGWIGRDCFCIEDGVEFGGERGHNGFPKTNK